MAKLTRLDVETWIRQMPTGEFHYKSILDGAIDPSAYGTLRKIMFDLCHAKNPCVEPVGKKDGYYRPIQDLPEPINWQDVPERVDFPIELPFSLREYAFIYPNTVIVVAGSKSSGKTGFLYRTVALNINKYIINNNGGGGGNRPLKVVLLSNMEGGREQLRDRFSSMDIEIPRPAPFAVFEAYENFHDLVNEPDALYVIDYIDAPEGTDFYLIGAAITKVRRKLRNSVAVIGLQKPSNRDVAYGGEHTLKDATLALAMDKNKIKIVDCKVPTDPNIFPNKMAWTFTMSNQGTNFENIAPWIENE